MVRLEQAIPGLRLGQRVPQPVVFGVETIGPLLGLVDEGLAVRGQLVPGLRAEPSTPSRRASAHGTSVRIKLSFRDGRGVRDGGVRTSAARSTSGRPSPGRFPIGGRDVQTGAPSETRGARTLTTRLRAGRAAASTLDPSRRLGPGGVEPPSGGYRPPVLPLNHGPGFRYRRRLTALEGPMMDSIAGGGPGGARIHVCGAFRPPLDHLSYRPPSPADRGRRSALLSCRPSKVQRREVSDRFAANSPKGRDSARRERRARPPGDRLRGRRAILRCYPSIRRRTSLSAVGEGAGPGSLTRRRNPDWPGVVFGLAYDKRREDVERVEVQEREDGLRDADHAGKRGTDHPVHDVLSVIHRDIWLR